MVTAEAENYQEEKKMINCPNCGKELADGTFFCDNCGTKQPEPAPAVEPAPAAEPAAPAVETIFCANCGQQSSTEFAFCQNCGASLAIAPAVSPADSDPFPADPETAFQAQKPKKEKKPLPKKAILFGGIGLAVVVVVILLIALLSGGGSGAEYVLYLKDDEIVYNDFGKDGGKEISEHLYEDGDTYEYMATEVSYAITISDDGKTIIYPDRVGYDDEGMNLYIRSLVKDDEAEKIDSDVYEYTVSEDFNLVTYRKSSDGILYQYNIKKGEKEKISSEVSDFYVTDDGKYVVFYTYDGDLYNMTIGEDKEKLDSDVSWISAVRNNCKDIYYEKEGNLYYITAGEDRTKIASDIDSVIHIYDSGEVYYTTYETVSKSYADFVEDDMASSDASFEEPEWPDYPSWWDYDTDEEYDAAYEAYEQAVDEYYDAWDIWYEIQNRNYIREDLEYYTFDQDIYTLHYYDGEDSTTVADNYVSWDDNYYYSVYDYALDVPMMVYKTQREGEAVSVKISEISSVWDVESLIYEAMSAGTDMYITSGAVSSEIDQTYALRPMLSNDGKTLYFVDDYNEEKNYGDLYKGTVDAGKDSISVEMSLYDSEINLDYLRVLDGGEKVLYFKDYDGNKGDLYIDTVSIDYDVNGYMDYDSENELLVYYTDYNNDYDKEYGTLKVYNFKEFIKVEDDVHAHEIMPNGDILYLYDYSTDYQRGELYLYDGGKEPTKIDEDVTGLIPYYTAKYRGIY